MSHVPIIIDGVDSLIQVSDTLSTVEANIASSMYSSSTTPTLLAVNTAKDALMDYLNDMNSDLEGNIAAFKTACGC